MCTISSKEKEGDPNWSFHNPRTCRDQMVESNCSGVCVKVLIFGYHVNKMDLNDIEVPRVSVTCRSKLTLIKMIRSLIRGTIREELFRHTCFGWFLDMDDWTENCILLHFMLGQQLELTGGLKFGVENSIDYNKAKDPIPFRRWVFSSDLDGRSIRGKDVGLLIESDVLKKLEDNDAISLCCVGIWQLVLLGVEDRCPVPNWIL
nr:hypothetical protein [Tanacetum cinerariifolium]